MRNYVKAFHESAVLGMYFFNDEDKDDALRAIREATACSVKVKGAHIAVFAAPRGEQEKEPWKMIRSVLVCPTHRFKRDVVTEKPKKEGESPARKSLPGWTCVRCNYHVGHEEYEAGRGKVKSLVADDAAAAL